MPGSAFRNWIDRFDAGLKLQRRMSAVLGIGFERVPDPRQQEWLRETMINCTVCDRKERCDAWLGQTAGAGEAPDFCINRALFLRLSSA